MPRPGLSADMAAMLDAPTVFPIYLIELHFNSATAYLFTGRGAVVWNGQTWRGIGEFGSISQVTETSELTMQGITMTLAGGPYYDANGNAIDPIAQVLTECNQKNQVIVYFGFVDSGSGLLVADPVPEFSGRMDQTTVNEDGKGCAIQMNVEPRRIDINRDTNRRYTDQDQRITYPTDTGFKMVIDLMAWSGTQGTGSSKTPTLPAKFGWGG